MATKDEHAKKARRKQQAAPADHEPHAPAGRGGAAMGRTVGLPFGGGRPRKRAAPKKGGGGKTK